MSIRRLRLLLVAIVLAAGAVQCWRYRHFMYPDGIQYIDLARRFDAAGFTGLLNGFRSPLYPLLIATVGRLLHPSPYWLYPSVQLVNFLDYVIALALFDYLLRCVLAFREREPAPPGRLALSPAAFLVASYATLLIVVGFVLNVRTMTPDMLVAAAIFAVSGLLLSAERDGWTRGRTWLLGAASAIGYFAKTVMFPTGVLYLLSAIALVSAREARRAAAIAALAFIIFTLPWVVPLSIWKGRPTFGDAGTLMYAFFVNGWSPYLHWIGDPPGSGTPAHPMQQLSSHPDSFAFVPPAPVTYPPFFDPGYWHEGIRPHVNVADQFRALNRTMRELLSVLRLGFTLLGPVLLVAVAGSDRKIWGRLVAFRIVIVPAVLAILLNTIVHVEGRLIAGPLTVLIVVLLASIEYDQVRASAFGRLVAGACVAAAAITAGPVAAGALHNTVQDLQGGEARVPDPSWAIAQALTARGLRPGDRIAVIGNVVDVAWAQHGGLSIVAELSNDQLPAFLQADERTRAGVVHALEQVPVRAVVVRSASAVFDQAPWTRISGTEFALYGEAAP